MIALNIPFQKIHKLQKSRWPVMKKKTINIPIFEDDVLTTVKSIPRTQNEAGIIAINLKRKNLLRIPINPSMYWYRSFFLLCIL